MKIITIEGLKGSGKNFVCDKIKSITSVKELKKFSKYKGDIIYFLEEFKNKYKNLFNNIDDSLGLHFYSNFFNELELQKHDTPLLLNRGLLSLPYFGYYGYFKHKEALDFKVYEKIVMELFELALKIYKKYEDSTLFIILECNEIEIRRRLSLRKIKIVSDLFFLENFNFYENAKIKFEEIAKKVLGKSIFLNINNENRKDICLIINQNNLFYYNFN